MNIDALKIAYPDIPAAVATTAKEREDVVGQIKRGGFRGHIERAKLEALDQTMRPRLEGAWDSHINAELSAFDSKIGDLRGAAKERPARDVSLAEQARDARLLGRAHLVIGRIGVTTDAAEVEAYVADAILAEHDVAAEFILKAAADRLSALEAADVRAHGGQQGYRSAYADPRGRVGTVLDGWTKAHPSFVARLRALEQARTSRLAELQHVRRVVTERLFGDAVGAGR